jgi:hypothetical protein
MFFVPIDRTPAKQGTSSPAFKYSSTPLLPLPNELFGIGEGFSTTQDKPLESALAFVLANEKSRTEWLTLPEGQDFELCVLTQIMWDLKSGDAAVEGSREYADLSKGAGNAISPARGGTAEWVATSVATRYVRCPI